MYLNAISDHFSTLDFPLSVFLVKFSLVIIIVLALILSHKVGHSSRQNISTEFLRRNSKLPDLGG